MLVSGNHILSKALKGKYAVGAFNTSNLEITQGILEAASKLRAPVIVATSVKAIRYAGGPKIFALLLEELSKKLKISVVLHLDHATDIALIKAAISAGYTSVMIDGSHLPFNKNVTLTKAVVRYAEKYKVSVEGEIGIIKGSEDYIKAKKNVLTSPEEALRFVKATGVHSLACAVGTAHGMARGREKLDLLRIKEIARVTHIPLVLHGASKGVSPSDMKRAIALGISKINIDTEIRLAFTGSLRKSLQNKSVYDPREVLSRAREDVSETVQKKIKLFGSSRK